ncbi:uncharacterized protein BcabD6B2_26850 [Babesia caballi]|uniref:Uncharacterized protein n=1 Tax=Babesia caballi TaxID=5871 RepID=A0AAV4LTR3_BABCB|nr:hypothetical protein, conserved [Babesia caballi]
MVRGVAHLDRNTRVAEVLGLGGEPRLLRATPERELAERGGHRAVPRDAPKRPLAQGAGAAHRPNRQRAVPGGPEAAGVAAQVAAQADADGLLRHAGHIAGSGGVPPGALLRVRVPPGEAAVRSAAVHQVERSALLLLLPGAAERARAASAVWAGDAGGPGGAAGRVEEQLQRGRDGHRGPAAAALLLQRHGQHTEADADGAGHEPASVRAGAGAAVPAHRGVQPAAAERAEGRARRAGGRVRQQGGHRAGRRAGVRAGKRRAGGPAQQPRPRAEDGLQPPARAVLLLRGSGVPDAAVLQAGVPHVLERVAAHRPDERAGAGVRDAHRPGVAVLPAAHGHAALRGAAGAGRAAEAAAGVAHVRPEGPGRVHGGGLLPEPAVPEGRGNTGPQQADEDGDQGGGREAGPACDAGARAPGAVCKEPALHGVLERHCSV